MEAQGAKASEKHEISPRMETRWHKSAMDDHVPVQVGLLVESKAADAAHMRTLAAMNISHMALLVMLAPEAHLAVLAHVHRGRGTRRARRARLGAGRRHGSPRRRRASVSPVAAAAAAAGAATSLMVGLVGSGRRRRRRLLLLRRRR